MTRRKGSFRAGPPTQTVWSSHALVSSSTNMPCFKTVTQSQDFRFYGRFFSSRPMQQIHSM
jgi:hypothetical protein